MAEGGGLTKAALALTLGATIGAGLVALGTGALAPRASTGLDASQAAAVGEAAAAAKSPRALLAEDEASLRGFLTLLATELNLGHEPLQITAEPPEAGVTRVHLRWSLVGDPFDLPPLLAGLQQQRSTIALERVEVRPSLDRPQSCELRVLATALRPALPDPAHFEARLMARGGLDAASRAGLLDAGALLSWRRFHAAEASLRVEAERRARAAQRDLPAALVAARRTCAVVRWSADRGLVTGGRP